MTETRMRYNQFRLMSKREQNMVERATRAGTWVKFSNIDEARGLVKGGFLIEGELGYFKAAEDKQAPAGAAE